MTRITAFIFDKDHRLLATGNWSTVEQRAWRLLRDLRKRKKFRQIAETFVCHLFHDHPWHEAFRQPENLKVFLGQAPKRTPVTPIRQLNPFNLPTGPIPKGSYCYGSLGRQKFKKDGARYFTPKYCPYLRVRKIKGAAVPWCSFLKLGGISNHTTEAEYRRLLQHFGSEKALHAKLPLFLLWDACKECGLKSDD